MAKTHVPPASDQNGTGNSIDYIRQHIHNPVAYTVLITDAAQKQFEALPVVIQARVAAIFERLEHWPDVSGVKPLRHDLKGYHRIRTGDYRVVFSVDDRTVTVTVSNIDNRKDVYR